MTVAEATPELDLTDKKRPRLYRPSQGARVISPLVEGCERFSYYSMQNAARASIWSTTCCCRSSSAMSRASAGSSNGATTGWRASTLAIADLRRLFVARLPHPDPRRVHRRPLARPPGRAGRGRRDHVARPLPDGVRGRFPVRAPHADHRGRPVQGQHRRARSASLYKASDLRRAMAFQIFYIDDQRSA